ncbi:PEP/pyruvate-binding domain-containing protein [Kribbella sp. NPDC050124]|uniref:PEP/pyruvate-binding domain-containing protein n=1 Tax=Kribbella sp. NPDC050124 TaxID=3364114 RepID=UPI0037A577D8
MLVSLIEATPEQAGGKAAVLGQLLRAGFPVPPGFVVPVEVYRAVTRRLDLPAVLAERGPAEVRRLVASQPLPSGVMDELVEALERLGGHAVAVRSSASNEDTAAASAAGQHDSFLAVSRETVAARVSAVWASLWSDRAIAYRSSGLPEMAVIVQRHIDADVAGVLFTGDPTVIEASWGLGESVVGGRVTPDTYTVSNSTVRTRRPGTKQTRLDGTTTSEVPPTDRARLCLDDLQLLQLAELAHNAAAHIGTPQDIEFALTNNHLWLLQSRPITTPLPASEHTDGAPGLGAGLRGTGGSAGIASGPARVVRGPGDFGRVRAGDILVCRFTDPAWTPLFGVVAGVVTETGGLLSHAAIVAREHRIPAVLGVPDATTALHDGQPITLNGTTGTVTD